MKCNFYIFIALVIIFFSGVSCENKEQTPAKKPKNYTVIIDFSDRILIPHQLDKDMYLIEKYFQYFEKNARRNLILNAKDRFSVRIIPQKNSPLDFQKYEDQLHVYLDELEVKDKNKVVESLSKNLPKILENLKKDALYSQKPHDYFGVDIWTFLHDYANGLSKTGFDNTMLLITDGYFDFENQAHVMQNENQYTSTRFLNELKGTDWKQRAETKKMGLVPIKLEKNTKWIVAGIAGKKSNDILQTEKVSYFWKKWLVDSGIAAPQLILNGSKSEMTSNLTSQLN